MTFQLTTLGQSTFELGMFLTYGVLTTDVWTNDAFGDLAGDVLTSDILIDKLSFLALGLVIQTCKRRKHFGDKRMD
jgi:hypothetical protein